MEKLTKEGINSFKFFLAYKGAMAVTDQQLLNGLRRSKELGALPMVCLPWSQFLDPLHMVSALPTIIDKPMLLISKFCSLEPLSHAHSQSRALWQTHR